MFLVLLTSAAMSLSSPMANGRKGVGRPAPTLPNTDSYTWYCCRCLRINDGRPEEKKYSKCGGCGHRRCRRCNIVWKAIKAGANRIKRAAEVSIEYARDKLSPTTYQRLKDEDETTTVEKGSSGTSDGSSGKGEVEVEKICDEVATLAV